MQRQWDLLVGVAGTVTTWGFAEANAVVAFLAGVLTLILLGFRVRREWLRRNLGFVRDKKGKVKTDFERKLPGEEQIWP